MDEMFTKEQKLLEAKRERTRLGQSRYELFTSVSYNPITCNYDPTDRGFELARSDAEAKHRLAIRAARLYAKNNSFHPILCVDTPKQIVDNSGTNVAGVKSSTSRHEGKQGRRSEDTSVTHPTTATLSQIISSSAKEVEKVTGKIPSLPNANAVAQQPLGWMRHY
jgi:hypothetical protein